MSELKYRSTKTYPHSAGLSCCFRQWRADSHCNKLHGYALQVRVEFEAVQLDDRNWVVDFGALKGFKDRLVEAFDHTTIVAKDDPHIEWFREGARLGTLSLVEVDATGCEMFAAAVLGMAGLWLDENKLTHRVRAARVEVSEHEGNSAIAELLHA